MNQRLIFFGTADFSTPALQALLDAKQLIVAVITKPDSPVGRGRQLAAPPIKVLAASHGIPVLQPERLDDAFVAALGQLQPTAGIVVAYGKILPQAVLEAFPTGLVNIHASLLPKYRGPSPIEAAILNGDDRTGVTLMRIESSMDTGAIYAQTELALGGQETRPQLYGQLSQLGAELLVTKLPAILSGELAPQPQDDSRASVVKLIQKADGQIDWGKPAAQLEREVRAYLGWPGSRTRLLGQDVIITAAHTGPPEATDASELTMECGDGQKLIIDRLKPAGKPEMAAADWMRGHRA